MLTRGGLLGLSGLALMAVLSGCGGGSATNDDPVDAGASSASWNVWDYLSHNSMAVIAGDSNLQIHYTFEEGTGVTVADQSGNAYHANVLPWDASSELGSLWRGGHNGNAVLFSERGRVTVEQDVALDAALSGNQLAISCWFNLSDTTLAGNARLVSKKQVDFQSEGFELEINPSLRRVRFIGQHEEYIDGYIDPSDMDGAWHHVVFNLNNGVGNIRFDGVDITDPSANTLGNPVILQSGQPVSIGALSDNSTPGTATLPGSIDDLRIYNRSLSVTEQVQLFTDDQSQRGLIAWWQLDEASGNTFVDNSGFGHDATGTDVTAGATGHINNAAQFTTADSRINAGGGFSLALTSQMSFSAWVQVDDPEQDYYMRIVSKKEFDDDAAGFEFAYYPEGDNLIFNGSGGRTAAASVNLDSNWHHVAATINGTSVQLYVDGNPVSTAGSIETPLQSSRSVYIGHRATDDATLPGTWLGALDDVRIYAHQLTDAEVLSIYNESSNNLPIVSIDNPSTELTVVHGSTVELLGTAHDTEDGNIAASATWTSSVDGALGTGPFISTTSLSYGRHVITFEATDNDAATASTTVDVVVVSDPSASVTPSIGAVTLGDAWQTINLGQSYTTPIVLCTPNYDNTKAPAVVRVRNASGSSFEARVQNPAGLSLSNYEVHYLVLEEGVYNQADHGIDLEALRFNSTRTDHDASWTAEAINYANAYTSPVVLGQVASENNSEWSVFWSRGSSYQNPVSASLAYIGKHVAEDSNITRADEELHYMVAESGNGSFAGLTYHVGIGGDQVAGVSNSPAYNYSVNNVASASVGIVSSTGMDGVNGGWPILYGASPVTATNLGIAIDEDRINDTERSHTNEQVAFIVLADPGAPNLTLLGPSAQSVSLEGDNVALSASANDAEDGDISAAINWTSSIDGLIGVAANINTTTLSPGFHHLTASVTDSDGKSASAGVDVVVMSLSGPRLDTGVASNVSDSFQTITLSQSFTNMAVFCTVSYDENDLPAVARVRNASGNSFELRVQNPSGASLSNYTVHYQVFETGVYRDAHHGITMEILTVESDKTDNASNWSGDLINYYNNYSSPVILGQVMTENDSRWSQFWSRGSSQGNPASASVCYIGKHVAEDSDRERGIETIAYMVIESGSGIMDGVGYTAALGNDSIYGIGDNPSYDYALSGIVSAQSAMLSLAAIDGPNGGWPVLYGNAPLSASTVQLAIDEDQIGDSERNHTSEQVGYLILEEFPVVKLDE